MAFSGKKTVNNHTELLTTITTWLTGASETAGRDWTVVREDAQTHGTSVVLRNTGLSGTEAVYIGLYAATHADGVRGGLVCKVYKAFDPAPVSGGGTPFTDTVFGNGNGYQDTLAFVPCWNAPMHVWLWSSKGRVMLVVESNGLYATAYLGHLVRFALPSENPWPLVCLTDGFTNLWAQTTWHDSAALPRSSYNADSGRRSVLFARRGVYPPTGTAWLHGCHQICRPDGVWTNGFMLVPTTSRIHKGTAADCSLDTEGLPITFAVKTSRVLMPAYVRTVEGELLGELEGVRWCPDQRGGTESLVGDFTLFPDVNRADWHSFMALGDA